MKTSTQIKDGYIEFEFIPSKEDPVHPVEHYKLIGSKMKIKIPEDVNPETIHPDHLALITILAIHPFTRGEMIFPKAVSKRFFEATQVVSRYKCSPVDEELEAWNASDNSSPGLAFSGGADSTAALAVMPATTVPIFMDRPDKKGSLYDKSAAIESCRQLKLLGFNMQVIECDVEHIRDPVGFPTDVANAIFDGTDAIMLSGETSVGEHPIPAVRVMAEVAMVAEADLPYERILADRQEHQEDKVDDAIAYDACHTAQQLGSKLIVAFTESGGTAGRVSKYRPKAHIVALTPNEDVLRKLVLRWGVTPYNVPSITQIDGFFDLAAQYAKEEGGAENGESIVLVDLVAEMNSVTTDLWVSALIP